MNEKAVETINNMRKLLRLQVGYLGIAGARVDTLRSAIEQCEEFEAKFAKPLDYFLRNDQWNFSEWLDGHPWEDACPW